jgi:hypothetical protein
MKWANGGVAALAPTPMTENPANYRGGTRNQPGKSSTFKLTRDAASYQDPNNSPPLTLRPPKRCQ